MPWADEREYMASWVWPSARGGWYCRVDRRWYDTRGEAEEAVRRADAEAGIVWPWQPARLPPGAPRA
jgi:hypothetical protein